MSGSPRPNMREKAQEVIALKNETWATLRTLSALRESLRFYGREAPHVVLDRDDLPDEGATWDEWDFAHGVWESNLARSKQAVAQAQAMLPSPGSSSGVFL